MIEEVTLVPLIPNFILHAKILSLATKIRNETTPLLLSTLSFKF